MKNLDALNEHFFEKGWILIDLENPETVFKARDGMLGFLKETFFSSLERLEDLHEHIPDDETYSKMHLALTDFYRGQGYAKDIITSDVDFFRQFVSCDLSIQAKPYLRVARPGAAQDNIGLHRDTFYGASPYELSVFVPFTDLDEGSALRMLSGSHVEPDSKYAFHEVENPSVERGSPRHQAGIPYAPKVIEEEAAKTMAVPMKTGQVFIFGLSTVHGQKINRGKTTRVSSDIRVVNSLAPFLVKRAGDDDFYERVCQSPVSQQAARYLEVNQDREDDSGESGY